MKTILDLCGGSGSWSQPYRDAGYDVRIITLPENNVRTMEYIKGPVHGILAAPDCTQFAGSGARWWSEKPERLLLDALAVADACARIILVHKPVFWCLENPVGRLKNWYGPPVMRFQPCEYGEPYTKKTCLWGRFNIPEKTPVHPTEGSKMWRMYGGKSERTKYHRSITPHGFAKAFFEANP